MFDTIVILIGGVLCGSLNAIAGGGIFVKLATLIGLGVPLAVANMDGTYITARLVFANALLRDDRRWAKSHT